jgi:S-adenosylmethionine:tRNA ribosyltransferase-isomerase
LLVRPLEPDVERAEAETWLALARPARRLRGGERLELEPPASDADAARPPDSHVPSAVNDRTVPRVEIVSEPRDGWVELRCDGWPAAELAEAWGEVPLPPYIDRDPAAPETPRRLRTDRTRYQTVYARATAAAGSVAAPTAGLHFTPALLRKLATLGVVRRSVTLHVGPGTFQPPTPKQVRERRLHREFFRLPAATWQALATVRARGGRVVAVGTTTLRVLETVRRLGLSELATSGRRRVTFSGAGAANSAGFEGEAIRRARGWDVRGSTHLFLQPGDQITAVDALLTNFHLPQSSLLMLVAAFAGTSVWRAAYAQAIHERFRFYSYGDAMLILARAAADGDRRVREERSCEGKGAIGGDDG